MILLSIFMIIFLTGSGSFYFFFSHLSITGRCNLVNCSIILLLSMYVIVCIMK